MFLTSGGNSTSAIPPTAQNQQVTIAPHQMRGSSRSCFRSSTVETAMLARTTRLGAASPVGGMNKLESQHDSENAMIRNAKKIGSLPPRAASPPAMVPSKIAMKVAPSTSALPAGNSERCKMVRQDAVFDRTEQRRDHAEQEQRDKQQQHRVQEEADHRQNGDSQSRPA